MAGRTGNLALEVDGGIVDIAPATETTAPSVSYDPLKVDPGVAVQKKLWRNTMTWAAPVVSEICVGMEVTSYESAEIDTFN